VSAGGITRLVVARVEQRIEAAEQDLRQIEERQHELAAELRRIALIPRGIGENLQDPA
jgi:hypothetical protein